LLASCSGCPSMLALFLLPSLTALFISASRTLQSNPPPPAHFCCLSFATLGSLEVFWPPLEHSSQSRNSLSHPERFFLLRFLTVFPLSSLSLTDYILHHFFLMEVFPVQPYASDAEFPFASFFFFSHLPAIFHLLCLIVLLRIFLANGGDFFLVSSSDSPAGIDPMIVPSFFDYFFFGANPQDSPRPHGRKLYHTSSN